MSIQARQRFENAFAPERVREKWLKVMGKEKIRIKRTCARSLSGGPTEQVIVIVQGITLETQVAYLVYGIPGGLPTFVYNP